MKYYIIAGEASGDLHASNLMKQLKRLDDKSEFRCWGGDLMEKQGGVLVKHYKDLAFMGFVVVLLNLRTILRNISQCKKDILSFQPDVLILVDYPGFNLRIARFAKKKGLRVFYYISPQVWAWKQSRVHKIKKCVDEMFVILPFEEEFYQRFGFKVDFVGHPLLDAIAERKETQKEFPVFCKDNELPVKPIVAILPGSRKQEITNMLPVMLEVIDRFPDHQFVIAGISAVGKEFYQQFIGSRNLRVMIDQTYNLLQQATAALVTSGTATLETALFGVPEVVCYKGGAISFSIAKKLVKVDFISLVNLIMEREIIKELIQEEFNSKMLGNELDRLLNDGVYRKEMIHNLSLLKEKLGGPGASEKAAHLMVQKLK